MSNTVRDLTKQELAVIDYLYDYCGPLSFSEYLLECYDQVLAEAISDNIWLLDEDGFLKKQIQLTLLQHHLDPISVLEPNTQHKAYSALKALIVFASEEYLQIERVRTEVESFLKSTASAEKPEQRADRVLQLLLHNMVCRYNEDPEENIYASVASWLQATDDGAVELTKSIVWSTIRKLTYDGVVGITECLDDVKLRARYTILWKLKLE